MKMSRRQVINELHKPARRNFRRRGVVIKGIDDLWQADLVDMSAFLSDNQGFKFLLTVIDTFSKFAWAAPIKNKSGGEVARAMETILNQKRVPRNLQTDDGKEFFNKTFKQLMKKFEINHYSTYSSLKASIVERFNRTLKHFMWKEFSMNGNYHWINLLGRLIKKYNMTKHRTIKMKPVDVGPSNEIKLLSTVYRKVNVTSKPKLKKGDYVRISKHKHVFEKGYTPNWSTEIFRVDQIKNTEPRTYTLKDYQGNLIKGGFYELELLQTKQPDVYLVEKILKRRGDRVLVKWLGFTSDHNSWINIKDVI